MKRKGVLALALALAATLVIGVAAAVAAKSYSTKIIFLGTEGQAQNLTLFGNLNTNSKCLAARKMELYKATSSGAKLVDADLSSFNGAWAFRANLTGAPDIAIKVKKERRNHGDVICKGSTITLSANKAKYSEVG